MFRMITKHCLTFCCKLIISNGNNEPASRNLKTIGAVFFCAPAKIGLKVMKGNRSGSHLLLKYRPSHLIKFLSKYSLLSVCNL